MQTSVPGCFKKKPWWATKHSGFTLLELLVVLVVLSVAAGLVVVKGTPGEARYLDAEARKLSQVLRVAQQESLLKSKEIHFVASARGYWFEEFANSRWVPIQGESLLRFRLWGNGPLEVRLLQDRQAVPFLSLQSTLGLLNQRIELQKSGVRVVLRSKVGGQFVVDPLRQRPAP